MRILIIDDHPLARIGARLVLSQDDNNLIVGEAAHGAEGLLRLTESRPDLVTLDLQMPGLTPEAFAIEAFKICPELKILIVSAVGDESAIRSLNKIRISGYVLKDEASEMLLQAVRCIRQGATWFSNSMGAKLFSAKQDTYLETLLTGRERQVLWRIGCGWNNLEIAKELCLAEQTVRNYATTIYSKIDVSSRVGAAVWVNKTSSHFASQSKSIRPKAMI